MGGQGVVVGLQAVGEKQRDMTRQETVTELMHTRMCQELGAWPDRQNEPEFVGCAEASPDPSLRLRVRS